jgi:hypothetical protein
VRGLRYSPRPRCQCGQEHSHGGASPASGRNHCSLGG